MDLPWETLGSPPPLDQWVVEVTRRAREAAEGGDRADLEALRIKCRSIVGFTEFRFPRYETARHPAR